MGRKINGGVLGSVGLLGGDLPQAEAAPKVDPEEARRVALEGIEALVEEVQSLSEPVKREKAAKDELKKAMQDIGVAEHTTKSGIKAKIVKSDKSVVNEEAVIAWAKANGHGDLVKTITIEQLDMEALERAIYAEEGLAESKKVMTHVLSNNTTTSTTYSLRVTAPKPGKKEE